MISWWITSIGISSLYFFVGLLFGHIAESKGRFYALLPVLLTRPLHGPPFVLFSRPGIAGSFTGEFLMIGVALLFSYIGGVVGERFLGQRQAC